MDTPTIKDVVWRNCNHPDFPLRKRERTLRGKPHAEWVCKIRKTRITFGVGANDPDGAIAWMLWTVEKPSWSVRHDPRAGFRIPAVRERIGTWKPTWIFQGGPLDRFGVAIVDARCGILFCRQCGCKWRVLFRDDVYIPTRCLKCPKGCLPLRLGVSVELLRLEEAMKACVQRVPEIRSLRARSRLVRVGKFIAKLRNAGQPHLKAVKEALRIAAASDYVPPMERRRDKVHVFIVHTHDFDLEAEIEGRAITRLSELAPRPPRRPQPFRRLPRRLRVAAAYHEQDA